MLTAFSTLHSEYRKLLAEKEEEKKNYFLGKDEDLMLNFRSNPNNHNASGTIPQQSLSPSTSNISIPSSSPITPGSLLPTSPKQMTKETKRKSEPRKINNNNNPNSNSVGPFTKEMIDNVNTNVNMNVNVSVSTNVNASVHSNIKTPLDNPAYVITSNCFFFFLIFFLLCFLFSSYFLSYFLPSLFLIFLV